MIAYTTAYPRTRATRKPAFVPTNKILIAIPYWAGDQKQASELLKLLSDIEDTHNEFADILLVARFDCKHNPNDIERISRRFNVHTMTSRRRETGWPAGCNGLFFGMIEWFAGGIASESIPNYKAVLINEADTVPLTKNWVQTINAAWDDANKDKPVVIAGAMVGGAHFGRRHINGGCVMLSGQPDFRKWITGTAARFGAIAGWDWALAADFEKLGWANIPSMISMWQRPSMSLEEAQGLALNGTVLVHGVKDYSLIKHARTMLVK